MLLLNFELLFYVDTILGKNVCPLFYYRFIYYTFFYHTIDYDDYDV